MSPAILGLKEFIQLGDWAEEVLVSWKTRMKAFRNCELRSLLAQTGT
jgi:hypothetical protein